MIKNFLARLRLKANNENGFSLTELVVVIVILGILAAIAIPIYNEQQKTAVREQVEQDMMSSAQALSSWQQKQDIFNDLPEVPAEWNTIKVATDSATTVTYTTLPTKANITPETDRSTIQFCIIASKNIGGTTYSVTYNLYTKVKGTGTNCQFASITDEQYE